MKTKVPIIIFSLLFLAQGCALFGKSTVTGVVKTVNGGTDWQFSNTVKDAKNATLNGANISKLAFSPQNRETVFAGSYSNGLYKSEDSGASWTRILSKIFVYDFAVHPNDPKTIYVAGYYADHGKVLKTSDSGATWQEIYNDASQQNIVRAIALNPTAPTQVVIGLASGHVIKSADGGYSWQLANNFNDRINRIAWQNGSLYVLTQNKGLAKSSDFAATFQGLTDNLAKAMEALSAENTNSTIDHYNQFYVDPVAGSLIYVTTSRGLFKTTDQGGTWGRTPLPVRAGDSNARAIAVAQSSSNVVYTSVGATVYKSTDGGNTWQTHSIATGGYINYILIDPQLPQIAYGGIYANQ